MRDNQKKGSEYYKGYQAGYHAGIRSVRKKYEDSSPCCWVGEADGYADGELVYDIWSCGACGYYFDEWDEEPTWDFCPRCGEPMTDRGRMVRFSQFRKEVTE